MIRTGDIFTGDDTSEDYDVQHELGRGGFSVVHLSPMLSDGTDFVAKSPLDLGDMKVKKITNEFLVLKNLESKGIDNVVRAFELGSFTTGGEKIPILVLEFANGIELSKAMKNEISPVDAREILLLIAKTMAKVHACGYIHRDLKPDNIFVDDVGGSNDVTVIDFGIAAVKEDAETFAKTKSIAHTKFYAPPEQAKGTVSIGNDIFSLGATGYAMLVGETDLKRDIDNHISPPYNPTNHFQSKTIVDQHLFDVITKATDPHRRNRFATMDDMVAMLEGAPPSETFPRIIADGKASPLLPEKSEWSLGRNHHPCPGVRCCPSGPADFLINETSPGAAFISRKQVTIRRMGECAFILNHENVKNDTRVGVTQPDFSVKWVKVGNNGYPLGPRHVMICFGYADTPPGKRDEFGNELQPGPYKVLEYFPPEAQSTTT